MKTEGDSVVVITFHFVFMLCRPDFLFSKIAVW